jgi:chromosome segregation ATPase
MKQTAITGYSGRPFPNPEHFGLKWRGVKKLLDEQASLWRQGKEAGNEARILETEIRDLENARFERRADALRKGEPEPDDSEIQQARARLENLNERQQLLRRAGETSYAELVQAVAANRDRYAVEVEDRSGRALAEVEEAAARLREAFQTLDELAALREWIAQPERGFGVSPQSTAAVDQALEQARRKAAGELLV